MNLFECPQSSIHQDMSCGLGKLISQFIWLFWNALRPNFLCVGQMEMIPRAKMFLRTIWTTFMFIKNEGVMSLGSWPKIRVSVKMTYNVLEWEMTFQASNQFLMNMKVVHIVLTNICSLGVISILPTHKTLGLSVFQNSQMN